MSVLGGVLGLLAVAVPAGALLDEPGPPPRPSQLVGLWWVSGEGIERQTALRLEGPYVDLEDRSCTARGTWEARPSGLFVGDLHHVSGCGAGPRWLDEAAAFRHGAGGRRELLARDGRVVATLRAADVPAYGSWAGRPVDPLAPGHRSRFDRAVEPPPLGLLPATPATLAGRWMPAEGAETSPRRTFLAIAEDGEWNGWNLCSGTGGRWVLGPDGDIVTTSAGGNVPICRQVPAVTKWMTDAARAGFFAGELVLLDAGGSELGRLVPDRRTAS